MTTTSMYGNTIGLDEPYYYGSSPTAVNLVPALFDISIGGHGYKAETRSSPRRDAYALTAWIRLPTGWMWRTSRRILDQQPRVVASGSVRLEHGAGQLYFDRHNSQAAGSTRARASIPGHSGTPLF